SNFFLRVHCHSLCGIADRVCFRYFFVVYHFACGALKAMLFIKGVFHLAVGNIATVLATTAPAATRGFTLLGLPASFKRLGNNFRAALIFRLLFLLAARFFLFFFTLLKLFR